MKGFGRACAALLLACGLATSAMAEDARCRHVRFADVGWSDVAATTAMVSAVLEALGYKASTVPASVLVALTGMKNKQIDAFLGYWSPAMTAVVEPAVRAGHVQVLEPPNLSGARFTLVVPDYLYERGLKSFADIARFEKELRGQIHGIETGSDANGLIAGMIRTDRFGLGRFQLVESSEAGMLTQALRAVRTRKPVVFLGWEPHAMNARMKLRYLEGGDAVFGPRMGEATVSTVLAAGYEARCPNVATLLKNLRFDVDLENRLLLTIAQEGRGTAPGARAFLRKSAPRVEPWLQGVTTFDGLEGRAFVLAAFKG